jgi:hypothetical protein
VEVAVVNDRSKAAALAVLVLAGTMALLSGYAALIYGGTAAATDGVDQVEDAVADRADPGQPVLVRDSAPDPAYHRIAPEHRNVCEPRQDILAVAGEREGGVLFYEGRIETEDGYRAVYAIDTVCESHAEEDE